MSKLIRYDINEFGGHPNRDGDWVRSADVMGLEAQIERLQEEEKKWINVVNDSAEQIERLKADNKHLYDRNAELNNLAVEVSKGNANRVDVIDLARSLLNQPGGDDA